MCVPPLDEEPDLHFALLREIARRIGLGLHQHADERRFFEKAIRLGAAHLRIGTAILGACGGSRQRHNLAVSWAPGGSAGETRDVLPTFPSYFPLKGLIREFEPAQIPAFES